MSENLLKYFKDEKAFYEFTLLNTDARVRADLLNISYTCYSSKKVADQWYQNIKEKISDGRAINKLDQLYSDMIRR